MLHWSLIFWINLPLGLAALRLTDRALRRLPRHERPHQLDLIGAALIVLADHRFLLALSWGGVALSLGLASPCWPARGRRRADRSVRVAARDRRRAVPPTLGPARARGRLGHGRRLLRDGHFIGLSIYVPVYFELARRSERAAQSGFALIPLMCGVILGATLSGRLMVRIRHYRRPPMAGLAVAAAGASRSAAAAVVAAIEHRGDAAGAGRRRRRHRATGDHGGDPERRADAPARHRDRVRWASSARWAARSRSPGSARSGRRRSTAGGAPTGGTADRPSSRMCFVTVSRGIDRLCRRLACLS